MPKLIAAKALRYQGKVFSKGEAFEPSDAEAGEFVAKKLATRELVAKVVDKQPEPRAGYQRRDMQATQAAVEAPAQQAQPARAAPARVSQPVGAVTSADMIGPAKE